MEEQFVWSLPPVAQAVPDARQHLRRRCGDLPKPVLDDALLLVSEMVTNAIKHGEGDVTLTVWPQRDHLRIEVTDASPRPPEPRPVSLDAEAGRGLRIIDRLASRWGAGPAESRVGKTVWAEIDARRG